MSKEEQEFYMKYCKYDKEAKEVILNLIAELEKKDKIIDEMAGELSTQFSNYEPCYLNEEVNREQCEKYKKCKECIKQYFERKMEE